MVSKAGGAEERSAAVQECTNENIAPSTALQDNLVAEPEKVEKTLSSPE